MIIAYCCLLLLVLHAALPGSRLGELAQIRLRHTRLIWLALLDQVLVISVLPNSEPALSAAAHVASYGLAGLFFFLNRRLPGAWLVAAGGASNVAAIVANGGTMPASAAALNTSGWQPAPGKFANSAALPDPHLAFLGDVFATPPWFPVHSVFSLGDIIIVVGMAMFMQRTCRPHGPTSRQMRSSSPPSEQTVEAPAR